MKEHRETFCNGKPLMHKEIKCQNNIGISLRRMDAQG
jgi:hypothetical protein